MSTGERGANGCALHHLTSGFGCQRNCGSDHLGVAQRRHACSVLDADAQMPALLERGGHLRVGIEDTGSSSLTNVETVLAAVALAGDVGRPIARGSDARDVLGCGDRRA